MKHALNVAVDHGAVEDSNRARHEAPLSSIFSFVEQKLEKQTTGRGKEKTKIKAEMNEFYKKHKNDRNGAIAKTGRIRRYDYVTGKQTQQPATNPAAAERSAQEVASTRPSQAQRTQQTGNNKQHTSQPNTQTHTQTQRLPSIHELQPFEPQTYVFNLPGHCSVKFGPANVFPASSTGGQPLITGGQQQPQLPQMTAGMQIPNNNNMPVSGAAPSSSSSAGVDPFEGARSLSTTASLALSRMPTSNVNASEDFNRGTKAEAGFTTTTTGITGTTTTGGQTKTGNATGTSAPPMGEFRVSAQPRSKSKRVRTESETESEEDI